MPPRPSDKARRRSAANHIAVWLHHHGPLALAFTPRRLQQSLVQRAPVCIAHAVDPCEDVQPEQDRDAGRPSKYLQKEPSSSHDDFLTTTALIARSTLARDVHLHLRRHHSSLLSPLTVLRFSARTWTVSADPCVSEIPIWKTLNDSHHPYEHL